MKSCIFEKYFVRIAQNGEAYSQPGYIIFPSLEDMNKIIEDSRCPESKILNNIYYTILIFSCLDGSKITT